MKLGDGYMGKSSHYPTFIYVWKVLQIKDEKQKVIKKSNSGITPFLWHFRNATSVFLCGEEKFSDFSGEENVKREKTLQGQLHTKRTEVN